MSEPIEHVFPLAQPPIIDFGMDLWPQLVSNLDENLQISSSEHGLSNDTTRIQIHQEFHNLRGFTLGSRRKAM